MAYIKTIGLENFRLFKEKVVFDLAPITILTGTNSSGKSSLIKSLQLFKSSIKETGGINELNFTGGRHNLGWFGQTLNFDSESKNMTFTFDFPLRQLAEKTYLDLTFSSNSKESVAGVLKSIKIYFETGETLLMIEEGELKTKEKDPNKPDSPFNTTYSYQPIIIKSDLEFLIEKLKNNKSWVKSSIPIKYKNLKEKSDNDYIEFLNKNIELLEFTKAEIFRDFFYKFHHKLSDDGNELPTNLFLNITEEQKENFLKKMKTLKNDGIELENSLPTFDETILYGIDEVIDYLDIEIKTKTTYFRLGGEVKEDLKVDNFGKYVFESFLVNEVGNSLKRILKFPHYLESLSSFRANTERLYSSNTEIVEINKLLWEFSQSNKKDWKPINEFINNSLKHFGIGEKIKINNYQGVISEILVLRGKREILLADLGYGFSQLIPIILKIAIIGIKRNNEDLYDFKGEPTILLLEEPESNLHPSLQSKIADFIILSAKTFNIQFIIETHSEYLIRNFQYLIAKKELNPWDTKILYFHPPGSDDFKESPYRVIEIEEDGRLSNEFGEGFFDEIPRLLAFLYNSNFN